MRALFPLAVLTWSLGCSGGSTSAAPAPSTTNDTDGGSHVADSSTTPDDSSASPRDASTDETNTPVIDAAPIEPDAGKTVPDEVATKLVGAWAMRSRTASIQDLPFVGKTPSTSVALGLVTIEKKGDALQILETGCRVRIESTSTLAKTEIPDAVPRSVPTQTALLRAWTSGATIEVVRDETALGIGVKLLDAMTEALPDKSTDPRVWDQDKDGNPGVTAKVSGFATGDVYVVQRQRDAWHGKLDPDGSIRALLTDRSEQSTIGASNPALNQNIKSSADPDASKSNLRLVRLTKTYDCEALIADEGKLFP